MRIETSAGPVHLRATGSGPPLLFLHGFFVSGAIWDAVVADLSEDHTCVIVDLPFGGHTEPMRPDADLSVGGVADIISVVAARFGPCTVIGNDTGSVVAQLLALRHPTVVSRLVLSSHEAYDNFPPGISGRAHVAATRTTVGAQILLNATRWRIGRRAVYGGLAARPVTADQAETWTRSARSDTRVLDDFRSASQAIDPAITRGIAHALDQIVVPILVLWGNEDALMPTQHGVRTADPVARGSFEIVERARTLIPHDNPAGMTRHFRRWSRDHPAV